MGRTRDVSKILTSNTSILSLASASSIYQTIATTGLVEITPPTISVTGGSGSVSTTGLVSFTSASAISLNNVFSSTYDIYRIIMRVVDTGSNNYFIRTRVSDSDLTSSIYRHVTPASATVNGTFTSFTFGNNQNSAFVGRVGTGGSIFIGDISSPFLSLNTHIISTSTFADGTNSHSVEGSGFVNDTVSYTGFTIGGFSSATGTISVYGYNK
jgi:hypothetical protein